VFSIGQAVLLHLKERQARREERSLVTPKERRTTQRGAFSGATRRAGPIFRPAALSFTHADHDTQRSFCLAGQKI